MTPFPDLLRHWRKLRRLSQLDLALDAQVSARHISFLETGRARPSPGMIARLGEVLSLPLEARNELLVSTGFAPRYSARPLSDEAMQPVIQAVRHMLDRHAPYPGLALDRLWTVQMMNQPAHRLFAPFGLDSGGSLLDLICAPGMSDVVENWPEVAHHSATRLRAESRAAGGLDLLDEAARHLMKQADTHFTTPDGPVIPVIYKLGPTRLSLFGTIAQFSTVSDTTLDDLKIELFFPADADSDALLRSLAAE